MNEKYRHEIKYVCGDTELKLVEKRLQSLMRPDPYAGDTGEYVIRSVYFDDYRRSCFYENENGIAPREKFRIRIYNCSEKRITLEKKTKIRDMTGKQGYILDYDTCMKMIRGEKLLECMGRNPLLDEWILARNNRLLKPILLGEYVRKPYVYPLGNVRITFDRNISASRKWPDMFNKQIPRVSVLPTGYHVLEVKYDDFLPDVIYQLIENGHMQQSAFSKFYLGCKALEGRLL